MLITNARKLNPNPRHLQKKTQSEKQCHRLCEQGEEEKALTTNNSATIRGGV